MRYHWGHLVAAAVFAVAVCEQDACGQVRELPQLAQAKQAKFDRSQLSLRDAEVFSKLRDAVIDRWHASVEKQRIRLQGFIDLRFAEIERLAKASSEFNVSPAGMRRLRLASKGAVDKYLFESATKEGKWYDKQAYDIMKQMKAHQVSVKQILERHANYDSQFATDVDTVVPIVAKIEKTARMKKAFDAVLEDSSRQVLGELQVKRAVNARLAFLDFIVAMVSQQLLLTEGQEIAFKKAIVRHQPVITVKMMDELNGDWEDIITSMSAMPRSDLLAIFSPSQVEECMGLVEELGLEFDDDEEAFEKNPIAVGKRFVENQVELLCIAGLRFCSPMTGPEQQIIQRERYARHMARAAIRPRIVHIKTTVRMTPAEKKRFGQSADQAADEYVRIAFKPLYEQLEFANRPDDQSAKVVKSVNKIKTEVEEKAASVNDEKAADGEGESGVRQVDFSGIGHLTYSGNMDDGSELEAAILNSKLWEKVIAEHLSPEQIEQLQKEKIRRLAGPRDAYTMLMVYWFDRAMCMSAVQCEQILKLVESHQRPIKNKQAKLGQEAIWASGIGAMYRVPKKQLLTFLSPLQVEIWTEMIKEFGAVEQWEEEEVLDVEIEAPAEDVPADPEPVRLEN